MKVSLTNLTVLAAVATVAACSQPLSQLSTEASPAIADSTADSAVAVSGEVEYQLASAIDAVTNSLGIPDSALSESSPSEEGGAGPEAVEVAWDIDVESYLTHDRVTHYLNLFTGPAKSRIEQRLERGKRYEPMIRQTFRERGIPEDMYYLGLVESGYDPHAYSRAAAVGMWQFMSSTGRGVGMRIDHWVDERRDPVRSTLAAATFLNSLQKQFGSYYLAAAAYNGGPGRVSRGLARFQDELEEVEGDDRFFALAEQSYLKSETRNYVPQLIAAALVGKDPSKYGLVISDSVAPFAYDSVTVEPLTSLGAIAAATGITIDDVRDLNPQFLRGVTPPSVPSQIRVPVGMGAVFAERFALLDEESRVAFNKVKSKKGQTLGSVAKTHGVTTRVLSWYNPKLSTSKALPTGTTVLVPAQHVIAAARDVPNPSIERYGSAQTVNGRVVHIVKRGESLGLIARRYRTSVNALMKNNGLKRTVVYPGQHIIVRPAASARSASR